MHFNKLTLVVSPNYRERKVPGAIFFFQAMFVEERSFNDRHLSQLGFFHWTSQKTSGWTLKILHYCVCGRASNDLNVEAFLSIQRGCKSNPLLCVSMVVV
jgi:hypothetical protein